MNEKIIFKKDAAAVKSPMHINRNVFLSFIHRGQ